MGLDIYLYKILTDGNSDNNGRFIISECPKLAVFNDRAKKEMQEYYDFEAAFKNLGLNIANYQWDSSDCDEFVWVKKSKLDFIYRRMYNYPSEKRKIVLKNEAIPTFEKEIKVIYVEDIGYQRKGVNNLFYKEIYDSKDDTNDSDFFITKAEAINFVNRYSTDRELSTQKLILLFVEGETFIYLSY